MSGVLARDQRMGFPEAAARDHMGLHSRLWPLSPGQGQPQGCRLALLSLLTHLVPSWGLGCVIPCAPRTMNQLLGSGTHAS